MTIRLVSVRYRSLAGDDALIASARENVLSVVSMHGELVNLIINRAIQNGIFQET